MLSTLFSPFAGTSMSVMILSGRYQLKLARQKGGVSDIVFVEHLWWDQVRGCWSSRSSSCRDNLCCRRAGRGEVGVGGGSSGLLHLQVAWTAALVC